MALVKARIRNLSASTDTFVEVLFNPTDYGIDRGANYAEMAVPGLKTPLLQFVRGEAESIDLELFLDGTNQRKDVEAGLEALRAFVRIDTELHAPPVCRFEWGAMAFDGVVTQFRERFSLFDDQGKVLRARVTMTLKSYQAVEVQRRELNLHSPDRTRVRVVREGETLQRISTEAYGDPRFWTTIAVANAIDRPRFLTPGQSLRIPAR